MSSNGTTFCEYICQSLRNQQNRDQVVIHDQESTIVRLCSNLQDGRGASEVMASSSLDERSRLLLFVCAVIVVSFNSPYSSIAHKNRQPHEVQALIVGIEIRARISKKRSNERQIGSQSISWALELICHHRLPEAKMRSRLESGHLLFKVSVEMAQIIEISRPSAPQTSDESKCLRSICFHGIRKQLSLFAPVFVGCTSTIRYQ